MAKNKKSLVYEFTLDVYAHLVDCWYDPLDPITQEQKELLKEEAENRVRACIAVGYVAGELNYESEELSCRGWWEIV